MITLTSADVALLERVAGEEEQLITRAVDWAHINSGSSHVAGLARMADTLVEALAALPGTVERVALAPVEQIDARGQVTTQPPGVSLRLTVRPQAPVQLALTGHYDTVFPESSPFQKVVAQADGTLNGPGIADMKGGISVMLGALAAFEAHPDAARVGYQVLLSPDEETGSLGSAPLLAELAKGKLVGLTYEPALADGTLASARKGSGNFHAVIHGRAAHAGRDFASGRNAIAAAARIAGALDALNGAREGVTFNVARIDGGGPSNIVPDVAVLRFNIRVPDAEARAWAEQAAREAMRLGEGDGLHVHLHGHINRPPKPFTPAQQALFERLRAVGAALGQDIAWKPSGGVCEGNNLFAHGLSCIDTLGVRGGAIHSHEEFAIPESFVERAQLSALLIAVLARD